MKQSKLYGKVKSWLLELEYNIHFESEEHQTFIIEKENEGIKNMMIVIAPQILIMEQFLFRCKNNQQNVYKQLLIKNRDIVHGAFVIDETGEKVIFRDTLQTENLDQNELIATINSLSLLISEYSSEMILFSK
ncbi:YbjN domain-containing protein [Flavobacterium jejuense]|uniref:YbjN domain-containing protein n=1 Tax=Flavobacterium jejuense TaxID=1544455 RepID=A0ABX0IPH4_9FLAO|nr:YbjN domain-containing protein [Flavobacterium jejuense]NHN25724.1 YbjN domain-containing protein [Flavobacterium jejuense]